MKPSRTWLRWRLVPDCNWSECADCPCLGSLGLSQKNKEQAPEFSRGRIRRIMSQTAILAARSTDEEPETTELRDLAEAADYQPVGEITQRREEDPTYSLGRGKAEELMRLASTENPDAVIFNSGLTPGQTHSLSELLPEEVDVIDRTRLVLQVFAGTAGSNAAATQVELARLRYLKPRFTERMGRAVATEVKYHSEKDGQVQDIERRIQALERDLEEITDNQSRRRDQRRSEGFDLVAVTGYANTGKSTLLRRLADNLDLDLDPDPGDDAQHADLESSASVADGPFETLDTMTRRATLNGRRILVTDTVGFVDGLPHEFIRSFRATLDATRDSDAVLLVVDASDDAERFVDKLETSLTAIDHIEGCLIPVINKTDQVTESAVAERTMTAQERLESWATVNNITVTAPVTASARDETGIELLRERLREALPASQNRIIIPNGGDAQSLLSWAYDHCEVSDVEYSDTSLQFTAAGNPDIVAEVDRRATRLQSADSGDTE